MNKIEEIKEHLSEVMQFMLKPNNEDNYNFLIAENDIPLLVRAIDSIVSKNKSFDFYHLLNNYFPHETSIPNLSYNDPYYKEFFNDYTKFFDKHKITVINEQIKTFIKYTDEGDKLEKMMKFPHEEGKFIILVENFNLYDFNSQHTMINHWCLPEIIIIGQIRTDIEFAKGHIDPDLSCQMIE